MGPEGVLAGLRVVEVSAFVAVPLGGMTLAQLGADVIRIDPLGGGLDFGRWPVTPDGYSLYWAGLNKGKKSVTVDVRSERGQDLIRRLVTARGGPGGILISNLSPKWLGYEILKELREDVIVVSLLGNPDGSIAVDYTVNAAAGFPQITGNGDGPVNHVLPAWDVAAGNQVALSVLAALLHRNRTGEGQYVELSLADVAFSIVGHLGFIGEAVVNDEDRQANGNYVFGSFGRDFATADGKRAMVTALTSRQWQSLVEATETSEDFNDLEARSGLDLSDEGARFAAREEISAILAPWFAARSLERVRQILDAHRVCWGPYQSFRELAERDPRIRDNPLFEEVEQPGIGRYPAPGPAPVFGAIGRLPVRPAPSLGEHTLSVLKEHLRLGDRELTALGDAGVI
jgi:2-methylfumaryl-CoA isomerase